MENSKNICPQCGTEMLVVYEKPALNLTCPKCGCEIATTRWEEIDLDDTIYKIIINSIKNVDINQIRFVSKITGLNFIQSKNIILNVGIIASLRAVEVADMIDKLTSNKLDFSISPKFPW